MSDPISRQAAIDIADDLRDSITVEGYCAWTERLKKLPAEQPNYSQCWGCNCQKMETAQSDPLTDKEQRIFLAAMGREVEVCKEVDAEITREPYEDSLVRTCHEIIRKVKRALWK